MTDPEPKEPDAATPPADAEGPPAAAAGPADDRSAAGLRRSAFRASLVLGLYTVVALGLLVWSLQRGRFSDAVLLLVAMLVALPPIVSYRTQVLRRLRVITSGGDTGDRTPTESVTGEEIDSSAQGGAPSSPSADA